MWYYTVRNISAAEMSISSNFHFPDQKVNWERKGELSTKTFPCRKGTPALQAPGEKGEVVDFRGRSYQVFPSRWVPSAMVQLRALYFAPRVACQWMCWPSLSVIFCFLPQQGLGFQDWPLLLVYNFQLNTVFWPMRSNSILMRFFCL